MLLETTESIVHGDTAVVDIQPYTLLPAGVYLANARGVLYHTACSFEAKRFDGGSKSQLYKFSMIYYLR